MAFEFITKLIGTSPKVWSTATTTAIAQITARLAAETEVRIFVDNSPNFGNQSCSVLLMKQLIDTYGFTGSGKTVTMAYPDAKSQETLNKLATLLPGLNPDNPQNIVYNQVTIRFMTVEALIANGAIGQVNYGFTGGADGSQTRDTLNWFAINLKVNLFLRLQPYLWVSFPQQVQYGGALRETPSYNLTSVTAFGWPFNYRGWYVPDAYWIPTQDDWTYYTTSADVSPDIQYHSSLAKMLVQFIDDNPDKLRLMPVYGIKGGSNQMRMQPEQLLPTVVSTALGGAYLDPDKLPAVVVSMNNDISDKQYNSSLDVCHGLRTNDETLAFDAFNATTEAELNARTALEVAQKTNDGRDLNKLQQDLATAVADLTDAQRSNIMQNTGWKARAGWLDDRNANLGVTFVSSMKRNNDAPITVNQLNTALSDLIDPQKTARPAVLFLELGSLPPLLFNYLMSLANYPNVFEGANTANLALNQGGCYLRMKNASSDAGTNNLRYPQCWYSTRLNSYTKSSMKSLAAADGVTSALAQNMFSAVNFVPNITLTTEYLNDFYFSTNNTLRNYYAQNQAYYHNPNNDKLMLGLSFLNQIAINQKIPINGG